MSDVVEQILSFNAGRDPQRLVLKYRNMRASAFVFLRGTCHLFYRRLPDSPLFSTAPLVWSCGDLHLQNFGSYKGDNRLVYFDLNDFDESALAPASWDLVRFLTSLQIGAAIGKLVDVEQIGHQQAKAQACRSRCQAERMPRQISHADR